MNLCLVSDALWSRIALVVPAEPATSKGGRARVGNRAVLNGFVYVLRTGIQWKHPSISLGFGGGVSCWRRVLTWQLACA